MWTADENTGLADITAAMVQNIFVQITQLIRFCDKSTGDQRRANDKLAALYGFVVWSVENGKKLFKPFEDIKVEQLVVFRVRFSMWQDMKSKPATYGINVRAAADVQRSDL